MMVKNVRSEHYAVLPAEMCHKYIQLGLEFTSNFQTLEGIPACELDTLAPELLLDVTYNPIPLLSHNDEMNQSKNCSKQQVSVIDISVKVVQSIVGIHAKYAVGR